MKRLLFIFTTLVAIMIAGSLLAEEKSEAMPKFGPPAEIKQLDNFIGQWTYEGEIKWDPAQTEWEKSDATIEYSYVCGGAAIQMTWVGPMMGRDMHGLSLLCYDRNLGKFTEVWIDDLMGRMSHYSGGFDGDDFAMSGEELTPDGTKSYSRSRSTEITDTGHKWSMEVSTDGENWITIMRGTFTKM